MNQYIFLFILSNFIFLQLNAQKSEAFMQSLLKEKEVLVVYHLMADSAYVDVITKDYIKQIVLGDTLMIKPLIRDFSTHFIHPQKKCILRNDILLNEKLRRQFLYFSSQLYQRLWQPIGEFTDLTDKTFLIVPSRELFYIPFELLIKDTYLKKYQDYQYLIRRTNLIYYPDSLIFIGSRLKTLSDTYPLENFLGVFISDFFQHKNMQLTSLQSVNKEIETIISYLDKDAHFILKEEDATEEAFKTLKLSSFSCIHLSTHAFISDKSNEKSYIILNPSKNDDGLLYLEELMDLDELEMNLELLSFSICGPSRNVSAENGIGFLRFLKTIMFDGTPKSVIPSLWEVYDKSTANFFAKYYQLLNKDKYCVILINRGSRPISHNFN